MLAADEIEEIVGAQVTFLLQEGPQDLIAFGRALAARGWPSPPDQRGDCSLTSVC